MKMWTRRDEWIDLALCVDSDVHTAEDPDDQDIAAAAAICGQCLVRPECIEWAIRESACAVFVAGTYVPDPQFKKDLRAVYAALKQSLPQERKERGDAI